MKIDLQLVKDGLMIMKTFGFTHALGRFKDLVAVKVEEERKTKLFNKIKPDGVVIKDILGNKMQLDMDDYGIHRDLYLDGIREPSATEHVMKILTEDDIVVDIGANIGYYVLIESKLCKRVYAVEPIPQNAKNLKRNVDLNQCDNVEIFQMAIGNTRGVATMNISSKSNWHSFYPVKDSVGDISVAIDSLDNFIKDKESPTFVRMDVEGYELNILHGMNETLKTVEKMFIEIHADIMKIEETRELIDILKEKHFVPELIIHYDRPKFSRVLPNDYIDRIYEGDKGSYEVFFRKQ